MYDFKKQLNKDFVKQAENKCIEYLSEQGLHVVDVTDNEAYFSRGIDIIIKEPDGEIYIDVKADERIAETGNIFFELIECLRFDYDIKNGWGLNKNLHYIYYVDVVNWILYIIKLSDLQKTFYSVNSGQYKLITHKNYKTLGFLIPINNINFNKIDLGSYE